MDTRRSDTARIRDAIAALTVWVPLAVVATTWLVWREALPADLPRQWDRDGVSSTSPTVFIIALVVLVCFGSALVATVALRARAAPARRQTFLWAGFAAGLSCGIWLMVAGSTVPSGDSSEAQVGVWPLLLMVLMGYGLIPFLIAHRWGDAVPERPPVEILLSPTETGAWISSVTVPLFAWTSLAMLGVAATLLALAARAGSAGGNLWSAVVLLVLLVPVLALARLQISVDRRGLIVATWIAGFPLKTVPLTIIESVHTAILDPIRWGGVAGAIASFPADRRLSFAQGPASSSLSIRESSSPSQSTSRRHRRRCCRR